MSTKTKYPKRKRNKPGIQTKIPVEELRQTLRDFDGVKHLAANHLGVTISTFTKKLREAGLEKTPRATKSKAKGTSKKIKRLIPVVVTDAEASGDLALVIPSSGMRVENATVDQIADIIKRLAA